jgi:hypothetical protein
MSWDGPIPHPCPTCGEPVYERRKYHPGNCLSQARAKWRNGATNRRAVVALTEMDRILMSVGESDCYHCEHLPTCRVAVKKGRPVLCQPEGVAPIPVVGHDVTSEFDGISLVLSVWEVER